MKVFVKYAAAVTKHCPNSEIGGISAGTPNDVHLLQVNFRPKLLFGIISSTRANSQQVHPS
jgi:hypothetical protein